MIYEKIDEVLRLLQWVVDTNNEARHVNEQPGSVQAQHWVHQHNLVKTKWVSRLIFRYSLTPMGETFLKNHR